MRSLPLEDRHHGDRCHPVSTAGLSGSALVVAGEPGTRGLLERVLRSRFAHIETAADAFEAECQAQETRFDVLIADVQLAGPTNGLGLIKKLRAHGHTGTTMVLLSSPSALPDGADVLPDEAVEVLTKPFEVDQLVGMIERARRRQPVVRAEDPDGEESEIRDFGPARFIGESDTVKAIWRTINRIAPMPSTVLIKGETGTGKELVARALHELSRRRGSYVPINCGAISPDLIEGELFGHLRGAFTGAHQTRNGLFRHADGGTLFLDEIGEMPLALQAKLLRVLEEKSYRPVGGNEEVPVNARVIAATNRDLAAEVLAGRFRKDLYYRINVVELELPPLRARKSDIPRLTHFFLGVLSAELGVPTPHLDSPELQRLVEYDWPGNIRELRNVMERALLLGKPPSDFLLEADPLAAADSESASRSSPRSSQASPQAQSLEEVQRTHILNALIAAGGNKTVAARNLGVSRKTIERKLKEWAEAGTVPELA